MNVIDLSVDDTAREISLNDTMLTHSIGKALAKHYPKHIWAVNVNSQGGVVDIKAFSVSYEYGYRLLYTEVANDPGLRCVIRAGGEILERANLSRGQYKGEQAKHVDGFKKGHNDLLKLGIKV